jgi:hypothetical protein
MEREERRLEERTIRTITQGRQEETDKTGLMESFFNLLALERNLLYNHISTQLAILHET